MVEYDSKTLDKKLRQVQDLLNRAEHPGTPPAEAESSRAMAEKLMAKYRLDEEETRKTAVAQGIDAIKPVVMDFPICSYTSLFRIQYEEMYNDIAYHVGNIKTAYTYANAERVAVMVGFESDVRYAQALYSSLRLHFANTLEPTVDPALSDKENIYRLRTAGIVRRDIRIMLGWPENTAGKVQRLYETACRERGEDPVVAGRTINAKLYRKSFADSYVQTVSTRLWRMRHLGEAGTELTLAGRKDAVQEAFYQRFPQFRPITREDRQLGEGSTGGPGGNCAKCNKTKSGYCRDHNYLKPGPWKPERQSLEGIRAGKAAGKTADLGSKPTTQRLEG
jgi:hypothetical protein